MSEVPLCEGKMSPNLSVANFKRLSVALSVGSPRCPYGVAYRRVDGLFTRGLLRNYLKVRYLAGAGCEDPKPHAYRSNPQGRSRYQTSEFPTTSEFPSFLMSEVPPYSRGGSRDRTRAAVTPFSRVGMRGPTGTSCAFPSFCDRFFFIYCYTW